MKTLTYINLRTLRFRAFHGVMPQERRVGADFTLTLRIGYPWQQAARTDDLAHTLSYADVYSLVSREMAQPSQLLEHVAGRIARALLARFPNISSIDLWLDKVTPPMGADCQGAGVELHLINDKTDGVL